jgi:hypothetical protein
VAAQAPVLVEDGPDAFLRRVLRDEEVECAQKDAALLLGEAWIGEGLRCVRRAEKVARDALDGLARAIGGLGDAGKVATLDGVEPVRQGALAATTREQPQGGEGHDEPGTGEAGSGTRNERHERLLDPDQPGGHQKSHITSRYSLLTKLSLWG